MAKTKQFWRQMHGKKLTTEVSFVDEGRVEFEGHGCWWCWLLVACLLVGAWIVVYAKSEANEKIQPLFIIKNNR